jgi:predicted ATPase
MLTCLQIENFKAWKTAQLKLAPLTALFGANSSGKSSLIQFLLLLKQTKDSVDRSLALDFGGPESYVDLGSFLDAVHRHDENLPIKWRLNWRLDEELRIADPSGKRTDVLFRGREIDVASTVRLRNHITTGECLAYDFSGAQFNLEREKDKANFQLAAKAPNNFRFIRTLGRAWDLPGPTKSYAFPDQARTYFQNSQFLSEFETAYVKQMDAILHLGPLREYPRRQYVWAGSSPVDVGQRGERTVDAILAATARHEMRNLRRGARRRPFQEMIGWWLREMRLITSFRVDEVAPGSGLYRAYVKRGRESPETLITDVGFGISQILPVLVLLYYAPEHSTIILEQPEIHLHPAVQSALADLLITVIKSREIQIVLESHSEHILTRLLRRIAEGSQSPYPEITPDDLKLYFCEAYEGESTLNPLELNLFGGITNWPKDFFGDPIGDIAAREEAAVLRRLETA